MGSGKASKTASAPAHSTQKPTYFLSADNFDDFWRVASKLTPIIGPPSSRPTSPPPTSSSLSRPQSTDPVSQPDRDSAYSMRNVPIRIYLPDGPVLQELTPPLLEDGAFALPSFLWIHRFKSFRFRHAIYVEGLCLEASSPSFSPTTADASPISP